MGSMVTGDAKRLTRLAFFTGPDMAEAGRFMVTKTSENSQKHSFDRMRYDEWLIWHDMAVSVAKMVGSLLVSPC